MGCSPAFLRLSKINHLDTLCNLAPKYCRYRHLNVVLVLYFSKICCNLASYNYNWAGSKGSVFHMCFSFFSFFCKSVFYSLCKCKHSGLHCSSVNTSSFEHVQGDFRKSKPLDSFHVSSLCLFEYMLRRCQERSCPDILLPRHSHLARNSKVWSKIFLPNAHQITLQCRYFLFKQRNQQQMLPLIKYFHMPLRWTTVEMFSVQCKLQ